MIKAVAGIIFLLGMLFLATLACGFGVQLPEIENPVSVAATAQTAVEQGGVAVQTLAAEAPEQGSAAVATLQASDSPDIEALREKLSNIQPDEFGNYTVTLTDDELNQVLQIQQTIAAQGSEIQLEDPVVAFTGGNVVLNARVIQPLPANLSVTLQPIVEDGWLRFDLRSASLGPLPVPQVILSVVEGTLNTSLNQALSNVPAGVQLQSVTVGEGTITIVGRAG